MLVALLTATTIVRQVSLINFSSIIICIILDVSYDDIKARQVQLRIHHGLRLKAPTCTSQNWITQGELHGLQLCIQSGCRECDESNTFARRY